MESRGEVPRKIFSQIKKREEMISVETDYDPNIINVCFEISSGQKFNEKAVKNMTFKDLCKFCYLIRVPKKHN